MVEDLFGSLSCEAERQELKVEDLSEVCPAR